METMKIYEIKGIDVRVVKKGRANSFTVLVWIVGFSTSNMTLRNKIFSSESELKIALQNYLNKLEKTSHKFQKMIGE